MVDHYRNKLMSFLLAFPPVPCISSLHSTLSVEHMHKKSHLGSASGIRNLRHPLCKGHFDVLNKEGKVATIKHLTVYLENNFR
jgi:hypothetical protein